MNTEGKHLSSVGSELRKEFARAHPDIAVPLSPEECVKAVMKVVGRAGVDNAYAKIPLVIWRSRSCERS